ncbi:monofunctional biosynthetic peptidoglycan transglycosylase [Methylobacterium aquaticum]|jgi:monofunctional biosynthetic peptidoglycan transglycosylase|uniref:Biosynthetic peptidoglycan transglycosylase n=1 Tax=Methylobacterium aquaticum TaxID=270351 RepID=A0A0J6SJY7_9HYPH|nr:peptidoglycan transglycosylase [Methylobacterium aquaticum]
MPQPLRGLVPASAPPARPRSRRLVRAVLLVPVMAVALVLVLALVYRALTPPSTLMLGRWVTLQPVTREVVALEDIAPALVQGVVASEDQRFCLHRGVDWDALWSVVDDEDGPSRGASTVTMQTVKNVFLWPGRSYLRKALEIPLALMVDRVWGKRRTMEIYLNVAEWGEGIFGAEAAARHWFGKSARDLSKGEAALLVATLPNPFLRNPRRPTRALRVLAGRIQGRMAGIGSLSQCVRP